MSKQGLSQREIIRLAAEAGAKTALETFEKEKSRAIKSRYDRRLRNTKLLLRNYRTLKAHCENAIYERVEIITDPINAIDILDSIDDLWSSEALYIESIKRTTERTAIILSHIDEMVKIFEILCHESNTIEDARRYRIIRLMYIADIPSTVEDIARDEAIHPRTVYKDIDIACERLSALLFGIDGLRKAL